MSPSTEATNGKPRMLKIGVVCIDRMGQEHALNILWKIRRANLVCACSPAQSDLDWAEEQLVPYGVSVYPTFEEMLAFPGLEAVVIASATNVHKAQTLECIRHGIHVLCEKPVTNSSDEVRKLFIN
jgi:myo-inositol 2-dehydrogenase/D-chiro-inositol 1-dehydrogenase